MAERLKAYGGCFDGTTMQVVAAKNQTEAAKLLEISLYLLRQFGGECAGDEEIDAAMSKPGTVFSAPYSVRDAVFVEGAIRYNLGKPWPPPPTQKG